MKIRASLFVISMLVTPLAWANVNEFVVGAGGDVSLSQTQSDDVSQVGAWRGDGFYSWSEMTENLRPLTAGNELNFMNLESVVSSSRKGYVTDQKYPQWSQEIGVEHLIRDIGFNLISVANNHMCDYGPAGLKSTYDTIKSFQQNMPFLFSGLGYDDEVAEPKLIHINNITIAFAAIGIKGDGRENRCRPSEEAPGMLSIRRCANGRYEEDGVKCKSEYSDYERVLSRLRDTPADLRILLIHEGTERAVNVNPCLKPIGDFDNRNVIMKFDMADSYGIDMTIGHHSHNARPIRLKNGRLDIFGLGNFLFLGGQNLDDRDLWYSYGLFTRAYYSVDGGKAQLAAFEIIPLRGVHASPRPWNLEHTEKVVKFLNARNAENFGDEGLTFELSPSGTGVWCNPQVAKGPRALALCETLAPAPSDNRSL